MADYKEKIKKLLALAQSPNEHEAKAALLKARRLMAEHKIEEADIKDIGKREVKDIKTGITCSKRRDPWINMLANVIGPNYCCQAYMNHIKGKQTVEIGFIGLEDDADICVAVFKYAVDSVTSYQKKRRKELKQIGYTSKTIKSMLESYGTGFTVGCNEAFDHQAKTNEQEWGLVVVIPQEVEDYTSDFGQRSIMPKPTETVNGTMEWLKGNKDGENFDPKHRIQEAN